MAKNSSTSQTAPVQSQKTQKVEMQPPALSGVLVSIFPGLVRNITPGVLVEAEDGTMARQGCRKHTALQVKVEMMGRDRPLSFWLENSSAYGDADSLNAQETLRQQTQPAWPKQRGTDEQYTPVKVSPDLERCLFSFVDRATGNKVTLKGARTAPATPDEVIAAAQAAQQQAMDEAAAPQTPKDSEEDTDSDNKDDDDTGF